METIDITNKAKSLIKYGLVGLIALSTAVGFAAFNYNHRDDTLKIDNARVAGTMVSMRVLTNGKVKELTKSDGDTVKAGDVIARIEVSVTEDQIEQLEKAVDLAKSNYAQLQVGQMVKVPVKKPKIKQQVPKPSASTPQRSSGNLAALEERKKRMELLYEMGAISRKEMEAAVKEYELAKSAAESAPAESPQSTGSPEIEYEIEYIDQLQPTPPEILNGAQLAIKQAELSLNVARQESQQTEVTAPVDGTIYYGVAVDDEVQAGDVVARVGDSRELWLEAEVTEAQFNKLSLGKLVSYVIDGNNLTGTIIDKIEPKTEKETANNQVETVEPAAPLETPAQPEVSEAANSTDETKAAEATNNSAQPPQSDQPAQPTIPDEKIDDENPDRKDKYIVKFSMPAERNFECKPNTIVTVTVKL